VEIAELGDWELVEEKAAHLPMGHTGQKDVVSNHTDDSSACKLGLVCGVTQEFNEVVVKVN